MVWIFLVTKNCCVADFPLYKQSCIVLITLRPGNIVYCTLLLRDRNQCVKFVFCVQDVLRYSIINSNNENQFYINPDNGIITLRELLTTSSITRYTVSLFNLIRMLTLVYSIISSEVEGG